LKGERFKWSKFKTRGKTYSSRGQEPKELCTFVYIPSQKVVIGGENYAFLKPNSRVTHRKESEVHRTTFSLPVYRNEVLQTPKPILFDPIMHFLVICKVQTSQQIQDAFPPNPPVYL
jgi:hypothetical protein